MSLMIYFFFFAAKWGGITELSNVFFYNLNIEHKVGIMFNVIKRYLIGHVVMCVNLKYVIMFLQC